mmetsp:Transcript_67234/g.121107  ORF Transcript_67234/g.121107 Transcript_67234/m.121107 type:complete len:239 (-) Transcript_67234:142-858(-)
MVCQVCSFTKQHSSSFMGCCDYMLHRVPLHHIARPSNLLEWRRASRPLEQLICAHRCPVCPRRAHQLSDGTSPREQADQHTSSDCKLLCANLAADRPPRSLASRSELGCWDTWVQSPSRSQDGERRQAVGIDEPCAGSLPQAAPFVCQGSDVHVHHRSHSGLLLAICPGTGQPNCPVGHGLHQRFVLGGQFAHNRHLRGYFSYRRSHASLCYGGNVDIQHFRWYCRGNYFAGFDKPVL